MIDADQDLSAEPADEVITSLNTAYLAGTDETRSAEVDLYDSGTTRHMSWFFHQFFNYVETKPVPIVTADKRIFQALGKGDMYVYLPNRDKPNSRILLKDVLYAPKMGVTLVLISRIAGAGSTVVFSGNVCQRIVISSARLKSKVDFTMFTCLEPKKERSPQMRPKSSQSMTYIAKWVMSPMSEPGC